MEEGGEIVTRKGLSMRKIKEILRLRMELGLGLRQIARSLSISHSTVIEALKRVQDAGLTWPLPEEMGEAALEERLYATKVSYDNRPLPDWKQVHKELKRKGVTLRLLWEEFKEEHPDAHQYSQFCENYRNWSGSLDLVLRQTHRAGEKLFVDYAGPTMPVINPATGEVREAHMFVGTLGASNYTFTEPTFSMDLRSWINSHVRAFEFFGGVPELLVPDNTKTGVTNPCRYEPDLNPTYDEMARHYGIAVLPTRPWKPRDKAKVEAGVLVVERLVMAPLRNRRFFSLGELEKAIREGLDQLNNRPFQKLDGSRRTLFETLEKPALRPLPTEPYEFAQWKKARVNIDYHIEVDHNFYSVPSRLARKEVDVRLTDRVVEILHDGNRVASHPRFTGQGKHLTETGHMPVEHQKHLEWSPSRLINWAGTVGPETAKLVQAIMENKPHPEQGYRSCLGIMRLERRYTKERLEAACRRALSYRAFSYKHVKNILENGLDSSPLPNVDDTTTPVEHKNVRGPGYFGDSGRGEP